MEGAKKTNCSFGFLVPACVAVAGGGNGLSPERGVDSGASVISGRSDRQVPQPIIAIIVHRVGAIGYHLLRGIKGASDASGRSLSDHPLLCFLPPTSLYVCVPVRVGATWTQQVPSTTSSSHRTHTALDCSLVLQPHAIICNLLLLSSF